MYLCKTNVAFNYCIWGEGVVYPMHTQKTSDEGVGVDVCSVVDYQML